MADFWNDVRSDVLNRLHQHAPTMPFEMKVIIAEDAARTVESDATPGPDGLWPLDPHPEPDDAGREQTALVREPECVAAWPGCVNGEYNPACCRWPKSCSVRMVPADDDAGREETR